MKMFVLLAFAMTLLAIYQAPVEEDSSKLSAQVNATNFLVYRDCVRDYVFKNSVVGVVDDKVLNLPYGLNTDKWEAQVSNGVLYIYGEATQEEINQVKEQTLYSHSIGQKRNGLFYPKYTNPPIVLPMFIQENNLVSIMEIVE